MTGDYRLEFGTRRSALDQYSRRFDRVAGWILLLCLALFAPTGCAGDIDAGSTGEAGFLERQQVQQDDVITVTAAVPSAGEARQLFGVSLYDRGIQPVWLEIENRGDARMSFLPVALDPLYYSPLEAAVLQVRDRDNFDPETNLLFFESGMTTDVHPGESRSGFVFTSLDEGTKSFNVDLFSENEEHYRFTFFIPVPGLKIDHQDVDWDNLYPAEEIVDYSGAELKRYLETLPCCTANSDSSDQGDPLNIVVIGDTIDVYYAFIRAGWDETETIHRASLFKTAMSFLFGSAYRYSPVSALYVFGRSQDVALQKARGNIDERNHLRLWMTPVRHEGKPVWIGQISRDIGVRFTAKTITTHKIDPDVDETREFLLENLAYGQSLAEIGYVAGVGAAPIDAPRGNLTGDPYFTDGERVVLWVSSEPRTIAEIEIIPWAVPDRD